MIFSSGSRSERVLAILLTVALAAVYLAEIAHGLPNRDVVWGYDANPLMPFIAAKKIFLDGWNTGWHTPYPNFHYYVLLLFLGPYMAVQWLLGNLAGMRMEGGYPYGLKDFDVIFMHLAVITRLVSVAMALGTAYWIYRIGRALHSHRAGLFAACITGFSPAMVYYVHIETLDVPMMFWLSAAIYCYVRVLQTFEFHYYVALAVLAAVSTATKDYAYGAFVLMPLPLIAALARHAHGSVSPGALARAALDGRHVKAALVFVAAFALAENWVWNFSGFINHVKVAGGMDTAGYVITTSFGRLDFLSPQRLVSGFRILIFVLGWAGLAICIAGTLHAAAKTRNVLAILAWPAISYYVFTVCQTLPAEFEIDRPYIPIGAMLAVLGGIGLARLSESRVPLRTALVTAAVALVALNGIAMDAALMTDPRYQAEHWLRANIQPGARVEFYGKRSELPRADLRWTVTVLNPDPPPHSDSQLLGPHVSAQALAERKPDLIVMADAFCQAYREDKGRDEERAFHAFCRDLQAGKAGYARAEHFTSRISDALRLPRRLAPAVTVFTRRRSSPS